MLTKEQLNYFLYLPPQSALLVNALYFAVVFGFAIIGFFSETFNKLTPPLARTDNSLTGSALILAAALIGISALIYGRTRKFFLCSVQSLRAAIGTTLAITLLYAAIWSLIQVVEKKQQIVIFQPRLWNSQATLNNLKYGSVLLLFSSVISMLGSLVIPVQSSYDFTTLLGHWKNWKNLVGKLSQRIGLSADEHDLLVNSTQGILDAVPTTGYVQPIAKQRLNTLTDALESFQTWYDDKTRFSYADCKGLDPTVEADAKRVLDLC